MRNQELIELLSTAIRDLAESEFIGDRDEQNNPLPSKPMPQQESSIDVQSGDLVVNDVFKPVNKDNCMGVPEKEWELHHTLTTCSLLGKSCQGALKLSLHADVIQKSGYLFGKHLSLAWQAYLDLEPFRDNTLPLGATFSLVSAPVIFQLAYDPQLYTEIQKGSISVDCVNYHKVHSEVNKGPGLDKTIDLQRTHSLAALKVLNDTFPPSHARTALQNIILTIREICEVKRKFLS